MEHSNPSILAGCVSQIMNLGRAKTTLCLWRDGSGSIAIRVKNPSGIIDILSQHKVFQREMTLGNKSYDLFGDDERTVADPPDIQR